jgi:hypothetical protein
MADLVHVLQNDFESAKRTHASFPLIFLLMAVSAAAQSYAGNWVMTV